MRNGRLGRYGGVPWSLRLRFGMDSSGRFVSRRAFAQVTLVAEETGRKRLQPQRGAGAKGAGRAGCQRTHGKAWRDRKRPAGQADRCNHPVATPTAPEDDEISTSAAPATRWPCGARKAATRTASKTAGDGRRSGQAPRGRNDPESSSAAVEWSLPGRSPQPMAHHSLRVPASIPRESGRPSVRTTSTPSRKTERHDVTVPGDDRSAPAPPGGYMFGSDAWVQAGARGLCERQQLARQGLGPIASCRSRHVRPLPLVAQT